MTETQEWNVTMLDSLVKDCFTVESNLPMFNTFEMETASPEQHVRQALYRVRIDINNIIEYYKKASKIGEQNEN